jgi:hypothetical protein
VTDSSSLFWLMSYCSSARRVGVAMGGVDGCAFSNVL